MNRSDMERRMSYDQLEATLASHGVSLLEMCKWVELQTGALIVPRDVRRYGQDKALLSSAMTAAFRLALQRMGEPKNVQTI